jgi:hypothetical protein
MSCIELMLIFLYILFVVDILFFNYVSKLVELIKPIRLNDENLNIFF